MFAEGKLHQLTASGELALAERARFELAEEREPLAGLANRCLGPLDYLSRSSDSTVSAGDNSTQCWGLMPCRPFRILTSSTGCLSEAQTPRTRCTGADTSSTGCSPKASSNEREALAFARSETLIHWTRMIFRRWYVPKRGRFAERNSDLLEPEVRAGTGGGGGIRTRETRGLPVFKTGGFVRSPTPPRCLRDSTRSPNRRNASFDGAAAEETVPTIQHGELSGRDRTLRPVEAKLKSAGRQLVIRRRLGR